MEKYEVDLIRKKFDLENDFLWYIYDNNMHDISDYDDIAKNKWESIKEFSRVCKVFFNLEFIDDLT